jgi:hypothetical protein
MHIVIQSSYIPTCFGGGRHHLQRRQYQNKNNKKKNPASRRSLSCHVLTDLFRSLLQHRACIRHNLHVYTGCRRTDGQMSKEPASANTSYILELTTTNQHIPCIFWITGMSRTIQTPPWTFYDLARKAQPQDLIVGRNAARKNTRRRGNFWRNKSPKRSTHSIG